MLKIKKSFILYLLTVSTLLLITPNAYAAEVIAEANLPIIIQVSQNYKIYPETQNQIIEAIDFDSGNEGYINNIINLFEEHIEGTSDELNALLQEALSEAEIITKESREEAENKFESLSSKLNEDMMDNDQKIRAIDPILNAMNLYKKGISLVKQRGHAQTAKYMEHALIPTTNFNDTWKPTTYVHNNDSWATAAIANQPMLNADIYPKFYAEIVNKGKSYGTVYGDFVYTTGDLHTALNKVRYNVTFTKLANGAGYKAVYKVTDTFDFAWDVNGYNNFAVGFGNNYCYLVQQMGLIKNFDIVINYTS